MTIAGRFLRAALMTPPGRGAVATIRVSGAHDVLDDQTISLFQAASGQPVTRQPFGRIIFGHWGRRSVEDVVMCRIDAATLEIHCHGGDQASERILRDWQSLGATIVSWQELIRATGDVLAAELQEAVSRAVTWRTAEQLLNQAGGRLRVAFHALSSLEWSPDGRQAAQTSISNLLRWSEFGLHLTQPWRVVVTGRPNVGKSSLINALLGYQRSIVFDQPGTTRDLVTAETAFDGWPVQLTDTAGLREAAESLEAEGIKRARRQLSTADLVVALFDVRDEETPGGWSEAKMLPSLLAEFEFRSLPVIVAHKCDLLDLGSGKLPLEALRVSSTTGVGLDELERVLIRRLIPEVPDWQTPVPVTARQIECLQAAETALARQAEASYSAAVSALTGCCSRA